MSPRSPEWVRRQIDSAGRAVELIRDHRPARFDGDVVFFAAEPDPADADSWQAAVTGGVHTVSVPVNHWQMTSPLALELIGTVLSENLNAVRSGRR